MKTEIIFDMARSALADFLELVPHGSCNLPHLLAKHYPQYTQKRLPSWASAGKEMSLTHNIDWDLLQIKEMFLAEDDSTVDVDFFKLAYEHVIKLRTGTCATLSLAYVWHLMQDLQKREQAVRIEILAGANKAEMDHHFVLLNRSRHTPYQYIDGWGNDCVIVDPWLRLIFTADKWSQFMFPIAPLVGWQNPLCPSGFKIVDSN